MANQVEGAGTFAKCKAKFLLVPTVKNGMGTQVGQHYLCHQCKGGKPAIPYTVTDQFGGGGVTTKKLKLVCNATSKS